MKIFKLEVTNRFDWVTMALVAANTEEGAISAARRLDDDLSRQMSEARTITTKEMAKLSYEGTKPKIVMRHVLSHV